MIAMIHVESTPLTNSFDGGNGFMQEVVADDCKMIGQNYLTVVGVDRYCCCNTEAIANLQQIKNVPATMCSCDEVLSKA